MRLPLLYPAWVVALVATLGSLYFSEIRGFVPCTLCWYQRILMYPLVLILGVATYRQDERGFAYSLPLSVAGILASVHSTRLKIKNGYPIEGMWGQSLKPGTDAESKERIKLLTQENAQLRAEIGSLADRLINVERIVTDSGYRLGHEIERLRDEQGKVQ